MSLVLSGDKFSIIPNLLITLSPISFVFAIGFLIIGLKNNSIAYSSWKNQNRIPDVSDVFDVYTDIIDSICNYKGESKQLILIEDLDRIGNKNIVIGFLRELYRFHNLLNEEQKKKITFIVSIKPESQLETAEGDNFRDDLNIFPKFFDFTKF